MEYQQEPRIPVSGQSHVHIHAIPGYDDVVVIGSLYGDSGVDAVFTLIEEFQLALPMKTKLDSEVWIKNMRLATAEGDYIADCSPSTVRLRQKLSVPRRRPSTMLP